MFQDVYRDDGRPPLIDIHQDCPHRHLASWTGQARYSDPLQFEWECKKCGATGWVEGAQTIKVIDYGKFDPGVRGAIFKMRRGGFDTTHSGDGSKPGPIPFPFVYATGTIETMRTDCASLRQMFPEAVVQATYSPDDELVVLEVLWPEKTADEVSKAHPYMFYDPLATEEQWSLPYPTKEEE